MLQTLLMWASFGVGIIGCASFAVLVVAYAANERRQQQRRRQTETDKAEITILFQTMRDVVRQQKDLARQFNTDLENKIAGVKQVLAQSLEKNVRLYETTQTLADEIERAKAALRAVQQQLAQIHQASRAASAPPQPQQDIVVEEYARKQQTGAAPAPSPQPERALGAGHADVPPHEPETMNAAAALSAVIAQLRASTDADAAKEQRSFEKWVGDDLEGETAAEQETAPPSSPEDRDASRRAFQALLNIEPAAAPAVRSDAPLPRPGDNGAHVLAPLRQRVVEYDAAGMSVAQIARELGIGKGEVRLMLSLARQKRV
ncbi:MAG: hypothetical protein KA184_03130 [Candidatus Hydrogenedentes bacterium]|nr:hypothetical protein [Candidatus Hydrogenedentota bacterium]